VKRYLDEWVFGVKDREEYWVKLGEAVHERLAVQPYLAAPVNYGRY
jgi:glutaconate CoA-transferase, subunit A